MPDNFAYDVNLLLDEITEIIKETGFASIEDFPKLFTSTTTEDRALEEVFALASEKESEENNVRLAASLADYIGLDDINMGLMAACAQLLKERVM